MNVFSSIRGKELLFHSKEHILVFGKGFLIAHVLEEQRVPY